MEHLMNLSVMNQYWYDDHRHMLVSLKKVIVDEIGSVISKPKSL